MHFWGWWPIWSSTKTITLLCSLSIGHPKIPFKVICGPPCAIFKIVDHLSSSCQNEEGFFVARGRCSLLWLVATKLNLLLEDVLISSGHRSQDFQVTSLGNTGTYFLSVVSLYNGHHSCSYTSPLLSFLLLHPPPPHHH